MKRPAEAVLSRLSRVRRVGPGRWMASCPTRDDKRPSLSVRELDDGRVLLHDFGGESVESVCAAIGLRLEDLFPDSPTRSTAPARRIAPAHELLDLAAFESSVAALIALDIAAGRDADIDRLVEAAATLGNLVDAVRHA